MAIEYIYPTQKGLNLIAKAQAGARIEYTRAQIGEGLLPEGASINALTALVTPIKFLRLATPVVSTNQIKLPIQFSSEGVGREFWWTEIGVWANDPDEGEILAAYGNAGSRELADHFAGGLEEFVFNCILRVANVASMSVVVDSSLAYVALSDIGRPGGVAGLGDDGKLAQMPSAADVGAARAAHSHGAGDITAGVLPVSRGGTGQASLTNVTAGNALKLGGKAASDYAMAADLGAVSAELANKANQTALDGVIGSKGQPNGIATLNSSGKLAQMPAAADVGAVPSIALQMMDPYVSTQLTGSGYVYFACYGLTAGSYLFTACGNFNRSGSDLYRAVYTLIIHISCDWDSANKVTIARVSHAPLLISCLFGAGSDDKLDVGFNNMIKTTPWVAWQSGSEPGKIYISATSSTSSSPSDWSCKLLKLI